MCVCCDGAVKSTVIDFFSVVLLILSVTDSKIKSHDVLIRSLYVLPSAHILVLVLNILYCCYLKYLETSCNPPPPSLFPFWRKITTYLFSQHTRIFCRYPNSPFFPNNQKLHAKKHRKKEICSSHSCKKKRKTTTIRLLHFIKVKERSNYHTRLQLSGVNRKQDLLFFFKNSFTFFLILYQQYQQTNKHILLNLHRLRIPTVYHFIFFFFFSLLTHSSRCLPSTSLSPSSSPSPATFI